MEFTPDVLEESYVVPFPDLPGCLSCGETIEEAINNEKHARLAWLKAGLEQ